MCFSFIRDYAELFYCKLKNVTLVEAAESEFLENHDCQC